MGDLAPFYANEKNIEVNQDLSLASDINMELVEGGTIERFGAWILDQALILSSISLLFMFVAVFTKVDLWTVASLIGVSDLVLISFSFYFLFSIFYFSFLDRTNFSTIGKRIMGLKVVDYKGKNIDLISSFYRSGLSLLSLLTMGLMAIVDFQSKITTTRVVKNNAR
jgi:uncharacterized RDD family membrane protein YckC